MARGVLCWHVVWGPSVRGKALRWFICLDVGWVEVTGLIEVFTVRVVISICIFIRFLVMSSRTCVGVVSTSGKNG